MTVSISPIIYCINDIVVKYRQGITKYIYVENNKACVRGCTREGGFPWSMILISPLTSSHLHTRTRGSSKVTQVGPQWTKTNWAGTVRGDGLLFSNLLIINMKERAQCVAVNTHRLSEKVCKITEHRRHLRRKKIAVCIYVQLRSVYMQSTCKNTNRHRQYVITNLFFNTRKVK